MPAPLACKHGVANIGSGRRRRGGAGRRVRVRAAAGSAVAGMAGREHLSHGRGRRRRGGCRSIRGWGVVRGETAEGLLFAFLWLGGVGFVKKEYAIF